MQGLTSDSQVDSAHHAPVGAESTVIILNGEIHRVDQSSTLTDLVEALNLSQKAIAVAVNRTIMARHRWGEYRLQTQDQVDVVRAIGGG